MLPEDLQKNDHEAWVPWSKYVLIEIQRLSSAQVSMSEALQKNTISLQEHMSQTKAVRELASAAHEKNDVLKKHMEEERKLFEEQLKPIKDHVNLVNTISKFLLPSGVLLAIPACIFYILKLLGKI